MKVLFVDGFVVFQNRVSPTFADYMTQYMHTNPHLNTKREGWGAFHNCVCLDVVTCRHKETLKSAKK